MTKTFIKIIIGIILSISITFAAGYGIYKGISLIVPEFECHDEYYISVFGDDKRAGADYNSALRMASGKPIYLREYCKAL